MHDLSIPKKWIVLRSERSIYCIYFSVGTFRNFLSPIRFFAGVALSLLCLEKQAALCGRRDIVRRISYITSLLSGVAISLVLVVIYWEAAIWHANHVNRNLRNVDQSAYMALTRRIHHMIKGHPDMNPRNPEKPLPVTSDGNRTSIYPFIQIISISENDQEFFRRGKYVNIGLSLALLIALFFIFRKFFHLFPSITLILITGFTVFLSKAPYFQADILSYFLAFCGFLLIACLLQKPCWKLAAGTGATLALGYLTKATTLPMFTLCICFLLFAGIISAVCGRKQINNHRHRHRWFISCATVVVAFIVVLAPHLIENKQTYGRFIYNVNYFYIWMDSWAEVKARGPHAYGDSIGWPQMPAKQIPTLSKYLREHTAWQIQQRFVKDVRVAWRNAMDTPWLKFVMLYIFFAVTLGIAGTRVTVEYVKGHAITVLFVATYLPILFILIIWVISNANGGGNRHTLQLFLPLMFSLFIFLSSPNISRIRAFHIPAVTAFHAVMLIILCRDIYLIATHHLLNRFAGA